MVERCRTTLRRTLGHALQAGFIDRSSSWQGWSFFGDHLAPSRIGRNESQLIQQLLRDPRGGSRGEVFQLVDDLGASDADEVHLVNDGVLPQASSALAAKLTAIQAYETVCAQLGGCIRLAALPFVTSGFSRARGCRMVPQKEVPHDHLSLATGARDR